MWSYDVMPFDLHFQLDNVINVNDDEFTSFDDAQVTSDIIENTIQDTLSTLLKV